MLTVAEAADRLRVDPRQVYRWVNRGMLAAIRYPTRKGDPDGAIRLDAADIDAFIERHRQPTT